MKILHLDTNHPLLLNQLNNLGFTNDEDYTSSKQDIDKLILDILPNVLNIDKKKNKLRNLMYSMSKKDLTIKNVGTNRYPIWVEV